MLRALSLALLLAAPAAALEPRAAGPEAARGAASADIGFGAVGVKNVAWQGGAVVMPLTDSKGRKFANIRLLSKSIYRRLERCFLAGCPAPAKAAPRPAYRVAELKPLKSAFRVANAEVVFDEELSVTAGLMASRKEEGTFWVSFPPDFVFSDPSFKSAVESAVIAAWAAKEK